MKRPHLNVRLQVREQTEDESRRFEIALDEFIEAFVRCHVERLRAASQPDPAPTPPERDDVQKS